MADQHPDERLIEALKSQFRHDLEMMSKVWAPNDRPPFRAKLTDEELAQQAIKYTDADWLSFQRAIAAIPNQRDRGEALAKMMVLQAWVRLVQIGWRTPTGEDLRAFRAGIRTAPGEVSH